LDKCDIQQAGRRGCRPLRIVKDNDTELTTQWSTDHRPALHALSAGTAGISLFILYNAKNALFFKQKYVKI